MGETCTEFHLALHVLRILTHNPRHPLRIALLGVPLLEDNAIGLLRQAGHNVHRRNDELRNLPGFDLQEVEP